jgi:hypothetical protein
MDRRDWELLDQQMRGFSSPRDNSVMSLTVAVVFLVGLVLGGVLFNHKTAPAQFAWNNANVATYFSHGSSPITSR